MKRILSTALGLAFLVSCSETTAPPVNRPPGILQLIVMPTTLNQGGSARVTSIVRDPDGDPYTARWSAEAGAFTDTSATSTGWIAPDLSGTFALVLTVSDGSLTDVDSVLVTVGNASLAVFSDPPDARVFLDGNNTFEATPAFLSPLTPGFHEVRVVHDLYDFAVDVIELELVDGVSDTVRFATAPAHSLVLDLGRDDFLELGGITFLANGFGFLYAARTAEGTGLFSSSQNPSGVEQSGIRLVSGVSLGEPVTVSSDGRRVVYVDEAGNLVSAALHDPENNGIINVLDDPRVLREGYGPALSEDADFVFTTQPSTTLPQDPVLWAFFEDSTLSPEQLAATRNGRVPTLEPGGNRVAFEAGGTIYYNELGAANTNVLASDVYLTVPAWSRWGEGHVAMFSGSGPTSLTEVVLVAPGDANRVRVHEGLSDPRFQAWSRVQRSLVVTHNPEGRGEAVLLSDFPIR